jgi:hypothetical protein
MGDSHATTRLHQIRGAGWRLGQCRFGGDGFAAAAWIARDSYEHGGDGSARRFEGPCDGRPAALSPDEKHAWDQLVDFYKNGLGYALEMNNRPQTLYGIVDSPVGLAAWMIDHDIRSYEMIARVFDGKPDGLSRDDVLDNITLYWLTNTAISSARLYWDTRHTLPPGGGFFDVRGVKLPVAVSAYAEENYQAPKSWAEKAYPKLIHYNRLPKGTHFAAWEQPESFVLELRASFNSLR